MKILKRQRGGALPLSWMTLWQSAWGRTPRWSAMPLTKVSTRTSWRWTGDLASLWVSCRSFSAGHKDHACPSFRSGLLVHWTAPMFDVVPSWKWTKVSLMHHIEWDSWHSPGIISILSVIGHSVFNNFLVLRMFLLVKQSSSPISNMGDNTVWTITLVLLYLMYLINILYCSYCLAQMEIPERFWSIVWIDDIFLNIVSELG